MNRLLPKPLSELWAGWEASEAAAAAESEKAAAAARDEQVLRGLQNALPSFSFDANTAGGICIGISCSRNRETAGQRRAESR